MPELTVSRYGGWSAGPLTVNTGRYGRLRVTHKRTEGSRFGPLKTTRAELLPHPAASPPPPRVVMYFPGTLHWLNLAYSELKAAGKPFRDEHLFNLALEKHSVKITEDA